MLKFGKAFSFGTRPLPPFDFNLTVKKPAGWNLFNSSEVYEDKVLWSAARIRGRLVGLKIKSFGTVERPRIVTTVFARGVFSGAEKGDFRDTLEALLGVNENLRGFYSFARKDPILRHVVEDLYGMHDTQAASLFDSVLLSICLQMARWERSVQMMDAINQRYGDVVEFDEKRLVVQPSAERIARLDPERFAKWCKLGYRAKYIVGSAKMISKGFPDIHQIMGMPPERAKETLMGLPGVGDYSADIINPHGGFPIDAWSVDIFGALFFGKEPKNRRDAIERVKREGLKRWGRWNWMGFYYVAQDLGNLSKRLGIRLRLV